MVPLYRTRNMESAANLLCKHFRHVLVRALYANSIRIRFRADGIKDPRVFFNKVPSQHKRWREKGGVLITWRSTNLEGPHDAIVFVECPKFLDMIQAATRETRVVGVIYQPPTWRPHEERIAKLYKEAKPSKYRRHMRRLSMMRDWVERLPWFTSRALQTLLRARARLSRSSAAPESPVGAEHPAGTPG